MKVYDVRDPSSSKDGMHVIGGFPGELIITFTCLLDYILANPANQGFMVTHDEFEAYLRDILMNENFPDGILSFNIVSDPDQPKQAEEGEEAKQQEEINDEEYMSHMLSRENISDYGLAFLFDINKDLVISREFIEIFYRTVVKIARTKPKTPMEAPEAPQPDAEGNEPSEEVKQKYEKEVEQVN